MHENWKSLYIVKLQKIEDTYCRKIEIWTLLQKGYDQIVGGLVTCDASQAACYKVTNVRRLD